MGDKPNCYECRYRGTIPGDAHSCCRHPEVMDGVLSKLDVRFGTILGGFTWPVNYNPAFLTACRGFKAKEEPCRK